MIENIMTVLEASTPALRRRYLERIRSASGDEAREVEERLSDLVEQDRSDRSA